MKELAKRISKNWKGLPVGLSYRMENQCLYFQYLQKKIWN